MTSPLFASIAATGFAVAFLHAALPTHWLPFVLVGRGQAWSAPRTLGVAMLAAVGHVAVTTLLGAVLVTAGLALEERLGGVFGLLVAGGMAGLGLYYLWRGRKHAHLHGAPRSYRSDRAAILGLVTLLALSPCEAFLPIFLASTPYGWGGFAALTGVLMGATALGMLLFTGLSLAGVQRLKLDALQRHETTIMGLTLLVMAVIVAILEV
ncbi:hypothetical protein P7B02_04720 [Caulobacter segnis]|uniref:hypothetical protein n=1 Tax=Caulobacter segnis TaxID=88688 RepID=UPI00240FA33C|nr:hypothetical protein [Caulobacter segnis]MDG2520839.1 hypothetical protein [Caulobacter segnis]